MNIGNSFTLPPSDKIDKSKKLFLMDRSSAFIECVSVLRHLLNEKQRTHVVFMSEDAFNLYSVRKAYWCWIHDQYTSAAHDGRSEQELHKDYKISHLLPILCAKHEHFADMILLIESSDWDEKKKRERVLKLVSVSDGSITGYKEFSEYFETCKQVEGY